MVSFQVFDHNVKRGGIGRLVFAFRPDHHHSRSAHDLGVEDASIRSWYDELFLETEGID